MTAQGENEYGVVMPCTPVWTDDEGTAAYTSVTAGNPATADHDTSGAAAPGDYTISATDGAIIGTAVLTITGAVPVLTYINITPDPVTFVAGDISAIGLTIEGFDQFWAPFVTTVVMADTETNGAYSNFVGQGTAVVTCDYTPIAAPAVGGYTMTATEGAIVGSAALTITIGTLTAITVTSVATPVTYVAGDTTTFAMTAQGENEFGYPMTCAPVWTDDEGTGVYSAVTAGNPATATYTPGAAPVAGTYTISATDGAIVGTAPLTITWGTLTAITVTSVPTPVTYQFDTVTSFAMTAQGENEYGVAMPCTPVWTDDEGTAAYSAVAAGNPATASHDSSGAATIGPYTISATDGAIVGTAPLTITDSGGVSPTDIWANKSGGNVRLEWADGTGPFEIYISTSTDGSGFNFAAADDTTANSWWEHVGVIDDTNDYSYVVRATGDTTNSEISWKIEKPIYSTGGTDQNWISLPYRVSYADLSDIGDDIGNAVISKVTTWSPINPPAEQQFRSVSWDSLFSEWAGADDAIVPGTMIMLTCKDGQDFNWNIVGSHISGTTLQMYSTGSTDQNWFSVPYHCTYADLSDIGDDIGNAAISKVTTWSPINPPAEQQFRSVSWDSLFSEWAGADDAIVPGTGIMLTVKDGQDGPWTPTVNAIGA